MLDVLTRKRVIPRLPALPLAAAGSLAAFGWLLAQDQIHPVVVYLLQLYLAF